MLIRSSSSQQLFHLPLKSLSMGLFHTVEWWMLFTTQVIFYYNFSDIYFQKWKTTHLLFRIRPIMKFQQEQNVNSWLWMFWYFVLISISDLCINSFRNAHSLSTYPIEIWKWFARTHKLTKNFKKLQWASSATLCLPIVHCFFHLFTLLLAV